MAGLFNVEERWGSLHGSPEQHQTQTTTMHPLATTISTTTTEMPTTTQNVLSTESTQHTQNGSTTDSGTSHQPTTSEETSSEQTTAAPSTVTNSQHQDVRCCCRCCRPSVPTCKFCAADTLTDASDCAHEKLSAVKQLDRSSPKFEAPTALEGSQYEERLAYRQDFMKTEQLTETLAALTESQKIDLGFKPTDMLLDCKFDGSPCFVERDFTLVNNPVYGNCYMFNSGWNDSLALKRTTHGGRNHGLTLIADVHQDQYVSEVGSTAGLIVLVQDQHLMPFPEDRGKLVSPGYQTEIALSQSTVSRLAKPNDECTDENDPRNNVYGEKYPVSYNVKACQNTCYQRHVIERCGCFDAYYPAQNASAFNYVNVPVCSVTNITQDDCKYAMKKLFVQNKLRCSCPRRCTEKLFENDITMSVWPPKRSRDAVLQRLKPKLGPSFNARDYEYLDNNLVKLQVFFKDIVYKDYTEYPNYPIVQYISDLGGVFGLWFGFALLTFAELCEYITDLILVAIWRLMDTVCNR